MKITNKLNLPKPFVDAVSRNYQYKEKRYSVTEMLKGYKEIILTRRHFDEMEQDVADSIWLIFGTAVHKVLEDAKEADDELKETKIHYEFPNGYTLSGQQDLYSESLKRVTDYKTGTVWKVIYDEWDDYRTQCLDYAILFRKIGFDVTNAEIVMVLKDWSATKAKTTPGYPEFPVYVKHFDFTEEEFEAEEKRRRRIPITDFTRGGEMLIARVVEGMQKAKDNLSMIVYGGQAVNPETEERLQEMHRDICSMLDELPW